jgi:hypothetical protein
MQSFKLHRLATYVSDFTSIALLLLFVCFGGAAPPEVWCVCWLWCAFCDRFQGSLSKWLHLFVSFSQSLNLKNTVQANRWNYAQIAETMPKSLKLISLKLKNDWNWKFPKIDAPQPIFPPNIHVRTCLGHFTVTAGSHDDAYGNVKARARTHAHCCHRGLLVCQWFAKPSNLEIEHIGAFVLLPTLALLSL